MRSIFGVVLAIFWVAVGFHCTLEAVPGLDFLHCSESQSSAASGQGHCTDDECRIVESGEYVLPGTLSVSAVPILGLSKVPRSCSDAQSDSQICRVVPEAAPPDLAAGWRFSQRAVTPARAPSFLL